MASTLPEHGKLSLLDPLGRTLPEAGGAITPSVVVATRGGPTSAAALRVGSALAQREGLPLEVLFVEGRLSAAVRGFCLDASALSTEGVQKACVLEKLRGQVLDVLGDHGWRLHVEFGPPAQTIARAARDLDAGVILLGIGKGRPSERMFGSEIASRVMRYATVPVFAVHPDATGLPHRFAVALDFSGPSIRAAHAAAALVGLPGELHLLHVTSSPGAELPEAEGWATVYQAGVETTFERLKEELSGDEVKVTSRVLDGNVAEAVADYVREEHMDAVAVGSHSHLIVDRLLLGSVPSQLLRAVECSVLIAPPR